MKKDKDKIIITRREASVIYDALSDLESMGLDITCEDDEVEKIYNKRMAVRKKLEKLLYEKDNVQ